MLPQTVLKTLFFFSLLFYSNLQTAAQGKPIKLHPSNSHYFLYRGKPTILITSGEHYGAVLNNEFDFIPYLDELKAKGFNLTRTFTGAYVEPLGAFNITKNTLAPAAGKFLCPWARSNETGYKNGGHKFDLSRWDENYFTRLKQFVSAASQRGIVVELALFCPFYEDTLWHLSPMNGINNINNVGKIDRMSVYTLDKNGGLLRIQEELVRKLVQELRPFDNVMYEICNEPYFGGVTMAWQHRIADVIQETEKGYSHKHLITQNIANGSAKIENPHPAVSVFNFHYAFPPTAVAANYLLNKPIGDNETGFRGNQDSVYRREGWHFILAGGALYNNLDYSFAVGHEKGNFSYPPTQPGGGTAALRQQLRYLKDFMSRFDFLRMKPDSSFIQSKLAANASSQVLSEPGKQYAVYLYGNSKSSLVLNLPSGNYEAEWMDPVAGTYSKKFRVVSKNGLTTITSPAYTEDIALRLVWKSR